LRLRITDAHDASAANAAKRELPTWVRLEMSGTIDSFADIDYWES
jgi:hypothetical protein